MIRGKIALLTLLLAISAHSVRCGLIHDVYENMNIPHLKSVTHNTLSLGSSAVSSAYQDMSDYFKGIHTNMKRTLGERFRIPLRGVKPFFGLGPVIFHGHHHDYSNEHQGDTDGDRSHPRHRFFHHFIH